MADFAQRQTGVLLRTFVARLREVAGSDDPEKIHDLRVAIRRFSRGLRHFAPYYAGDGWKRLRRQLRVAMRLAGAVRDRDIALEYLAKAGVAPRAAIVNRLKRERREANRELLAEIGRWQPQQIFREWAALLETAEDGKEPDAAALPGLASEYFAQVRRVLKRDPSPADLHCARLATKRFRYTLELFRGSYGPGLEARMEALRRVQHLLGEVNDCVASRRLLSNIAVPFPLKKAVRDFLKQEARQRAAMFQKEWQEEFDGPGREEWWVTFLKNKRKSRVTNLPPGSITSERDTNG